MNIFPILHILEFSCMPFCDDFLHRGDHHLSVMDKIRRCSLIVTSKRYICDGMLDQEPVLIWIIRSDISFPSQFYMIVSSDKTLKRKNQSCNYIN